MRLPFLCEKSGAIALVLPGLTAGWQAVQQAGRLSSRQAGWLADKIVPNLEIFKIIYWMKYLSFCYVQRYSVIIDIPMHFSGFFRVKPILR